ncbi:ABC transporter substrate-binding protein [Auraticoccus monumenti]|uniref:NitT/TauT family transport system substrate-binding protein n=1 Tax=Auraticoccus monumenti TaxID=675864 RepID=A0A1G6SBB2_9ACTN|nr:ABC transporter substrate-binding protein [Auraticoccus monumenti]SDD14023.1 NitT/TauT family transport system substrate-binding protein [Auraticoccus monumenti]
MTRRTVPTLTRRSLLAAAGTGLLAAGAVACAPGDGPEAAPAPTPGSTPLTLGFSYIPDIQFSPFYAAHALGHYAAAGLDVTLRHHGGSESLFGALESGEEDFLVASGDELLQANSAGSELVAVASVYQTYPVALIVPADSDIQTPADLRGRTVGTPGPYGGNWFALLAILDSAGLTPEDLDIKNIGFTQQSALTTGAVEGVMGYLNNEAVRLEAAGTPVRTITLPEDAALASIGLNTTQALAGAEPDTVRAFVAASLLGVRAVVDDPAAAVELSREYIPGLTASARRDAEATLAATIPLFGDGSGRSDLQRWEEMATFMASADLLEGDVDPSLAVSNDFLP